MNKNYLTKKDRLESLKKRGDLIKESFQEQFSKIKRINESVNKDEITKMVNYTNQILDKKGRQVKVIEDEGLKVLYKLGPLQVFNDGVSYEINIKYTNGEGKNINYSESKYRYFDNPEEMKTLEGDIKILQRSDMW